MRCVEVGRSIGSLQDSCKLHGQDRLRRRQRRDMCSGRSLSIRRYGFNPLHVIDLYEKFLRSRRKRRGTHRTQPQNHRRKPQRRTLHHQTRNPLLHQTKRTDTIPITRRYLLGTHRLGRCLPRLLERPRISEYEMGDERDHAHVAKNGFLLRESSQRDLALVSIPYFLYPTYSLADSRTGMSAQISSPPKHSTKYPPQASTLPSPKTPVAAF